MTALHRYTCRVSFGDCDPAAIAYYPNIFKWVDTTCHDWMRRFGGHAALCRQLGAVGIGLMDAGAKFRSPLRDGDDLTVEITGLDWGAKALRLQYRGMVGARVAFDATETRGLFKPAENGLTAGAMDALRALVGSDVRG
ncbi:MAG: acyl-CoA thioesterase [Rhodobacter sp.]|nr:acyl-CoA thioesterase [Paracoccaceae bacterium]MCC0077416.1 acyl-CoA thioesterase [Rhodobacter sp.]